MHEQSQTLGVDGGYVNVAGTTGFPLTKRFPFEDEFYKSLQAAVFAAIMRSAWEGRLGEGFGAATQLMEGAARHTKPTGPFSAALSHR